MSLKGFLIFNPKGLELTAEEKEFFMHPYCRGAILFSKNYHSPQQLKKLVTSIKQSNPELLITVDQEGGRVQRFREGFTELPSSQALALNYQENAEKTREKCYQTGLAMAAELKRFQFDLSYAPVLDLNYGKSQVISDRSFHRHPAIVIDCATHFISGMKKAGILSCGKHFPGHGAVVADSHHELPVDSREFETLWQEDIQPFAKLAPQLDCMMSAHVIYSQVDSRPATFSSFWLREVLRKRIHFSGMIVSDDLNMQAAKIMGSAVERAALALEAGCDAILLCHDLAGVEQILSEKYFDRGFRYKSI